MSTSVTSPKPAYDPRAWVTPEDLNVAPQLLGLPLATPKQRFWAMAIDLAALAPLSNLGNFFLLLAGGSALLLWIRRPGASGKVLSAWRRQGLWFLLLISLALGGQQAWEDLREPSTHQTGADDEEEAAAAAAALETAKATLAALPSTVASATSAPSSAASSLVSPAAVAEPTPQEQAQRIAKLEAQVKAQQEKLDQHHFDPRAEFKRLVNEVGLSYFWALLYFSILPVLLSGQTLGKKLLGLRVVELTGKTLTPMICFKRYGGYAAGMATGMTGFLQLIWDSNRQAIQDKTAHTVVIDARSSKRLALPESA